MTPETEELLLDVSARLEWAVTARDCPAIVSIRGTRQWTMSDYDYLRDDATAAAFEQHAAHKARTVEARVWVFMVSMVVVFQDDCVLGRPVANLPLREGEQEALMWTSYHATDGIDFGMVPYTRCPSGEPVYDDPEVFEDPIRAEDADPGRLMRATFLAGEPEA
ncbi:hypothetical protein GCM10009801_75490 [Streptomyces albiaxialis]|uniref:Uncharacterized protein n=1 Tax=Streptomyces albiaxialis TaxID=329523 RepID=A0ABP5IKS7_9ACTN